MEGEVNYKSDTRKQKRSIIYFSDINSNEEIEDNSSNKNEATKYLAPTILSILIYSLCAWATKVNFIEIIDLELPLLVLFTLIICESCLEGYSIISYVLYIFTICMLYVFNYDTYSLLLIISVISVLITSLLEKIYHNQEDYPNISNEDIYIRGTFSRLKYYILLSFALFVIFLLLGYFYPNLFQPIVMPSVENLHNGVQNGTIQLETVYLFLNNFSVAYNMILGGFYFSIPTVYLLIFNALFIGFSGAITNIHYFLAFTLPHGIIELLAIILSGAAGLRITHSLLVLLSGIKINKNNRKETFIKCCITFIEMFIDVIVLMIIIIIMLLIAAYIEANLTVSIGTFLYKL